MRDRMTVSPAMFILLPTAVLLLPIRWVMAWIMAVAVHELGHYMALRLCGVPVFALTVSPAGVKMEIGQLQGREALLCALAGPIFGLCLIFLARFFPCTAFCGWLQAMFNLLPIYPLDGGRALRAIFSERLARRVEWCVLILLGAICLYFGIVLRLGFVPIGVMVCIFVQKFLANRKENGYNRAK